CDRSSARRCWPALHDADSTAVAGDAPMLVHAGACLRDLVPSAGETVASSAAFRKLDAIELVRQKRSDGTEEVAFGARPFVLGGLPIRSLPDGTLRYSRRNGRFFLEGCEQEFVRGGILRGFPDFLKNDVFGVRDGHTLCFQ